MFKLHKHSVRYSSLAGAILAFGLTSIASADDFRQLAGRYSQHNLVSDGSLPADHTDKNLVNAWGVAFNPNSVVWVAAAGSGKSTLYDGDGQPQSLIVDMAGGHAPTGIVFNGSQDFIAGGNASRFIFATEDGTIEAWAPPPPPGSPPTVTLTVVDNSKQGANYKGLALSGNGTGHFLYATDFRNARIDVFDAHFKATKLDGAFADPRVPGGYAPFGIQALNGDIYVTYAKQDAEGHDDVHGPGNGYVNVFDPNGHLLKRIATRGVLNSPWGLTIAPASFGQFGGRLLVGNFGDGRLSAFDLGTGKLKGTLRDDHGKPLAIEGLWGLAFGNGVRGQAVDTLFFAAGPEDETHGLYGRIDPIASKGSRTNKRSDDYRF
jgi:uncharacterized protein (TIGR03118 family)